MSAQKYLEFLQKEIHSTIMATVSADGSPATCVIDMMLVDENGLYFLTAKGKSLYQRLVAQPKISITGLVGEDTMSSKSVTITCEAREIFDERLEEIFIKNPYMCDIYPQEDSREALTVFHIFKGKGEFFDLTTRPITRETFSFGGVDRSVSGYFVNEKCVGCNKCVSICPQNCIDTSTVPVVINQSNCLHCGACLNVCPTNAIEFKK